MSTLPAPYTVGTIAVTNGSTAVVGTGVLWSLVIEGDWVVVPGQSAFGIVDSVAPDKTHITLKSPWSGATASGLSYLIDYLSWIRLDPSISQQTTRVILALLAGAGIIYSVTGAAPDPGLGEDGQYALKTNTGQWQQWLKGSGAWVLQATPIGITNRGTWSSIVNYIVNDVVTRPFNGTVYLCNVPNLNAPPESNPTDWSILGAQGATGPAGQTVRYGIGAPANSLGTDGDFYIATDLHVIYGPRAGGAWPAGTSFIGPTGAAGQTVRYGIGVPANSLGSDGDFYIATDTHFIYGPRAGGMWPAGTNLTGPSGGSGGIGATGAAGADGKTVRYGTGAPASALGVDGDFYIALDTHVIYGPRAGGAWPAGTSLVGVQGIHGDAGTGLNPDATGTLAQRVTYDNQAQGFKFLETDVAPFQLFVKRSNITADWAGPTFIGGAAAIGDLGSVADSVLGTFDYGVAA